MQSQVPKAQRRRRKGARRAPRVAIAHLVAHGPTRPQEHRAPTDRHAPVRPPNPIVGRAHPAPIKATAHHVRRVQTRQVVLTVRRSHLGHHGPKARPVAHGLIVKSIPIVNRGPSALTPARSPSVPRRPMWPPPRLRLRSRPNRPPTTKPGVSAPRSCVRLNPPRSRRPTSAL